MKTQKEIENTIRDRIFDLQAEVEELRELDLNHVLTSERIRELILILKLIRNEH